MYDALCTRVWVPKDLMALQINGTKRWVSDTHLVNFGVTRCGLSPASAKGVLQDMKAGVLENLAVIDAHVETYSGIRHIEPALSNLKEHILNGCGEKLENELDLVSMAKLVKTDRLRQTFSDNECSLDM